MADRFRTAPFDWEDVRFFLALARSRSLSAASRSLRVNHATVARRVSALEKATGSVLFERRPDGYVLTAQGEALVGPAVSMEQSALGLAEAVAGRTATETVRLTTVRSLADVFLVDRLGEFRSRHPAIALEVIAEVRVMSLFRREAEVALRLGRPRDSGLMGRKVGEIRYGFYLAARMPADSAATAPLIAYDREAEGIVEAAWLARQFPGRPVSFHSNSNTAQAAAARAGFGLAMLPRYLGDRDRSLQLVPTLDPHPPRELWLLSPRDIARTPRVRAVLDAVAAVVLSGSDILTGAGHPGSTTP